jgi:O-antigen ligase
VIPHPVARWLDRLIEGVLLALLVFAPLAFGSVEIWSREVLRLGGLLLGLLALARAALGGLERRSGTRLWIPMVAFVLLVGLMVLPMPRSLIGAVSPRADRLYQETLPGYEAGEAVDREAWLAATLPEEAAEGEAASPETAPSVSRPPGKRTFSVYPGATISEGLLLISHLIVFWVAFRFLDRGAVRRVAWTVAILAMAIAFLGLVQALSGSTLLYFVRDVGSGARPMGPFVNRNHFAGYLELAIPVILGLLLGLLRQGLGREGRGGGRKRSETVPSLAQAGLLALMLAVSLAALVLSFSRGGLLATIIVLLAFVIAMLRRGSRSAERWAALVMIGGVLVAGTILAVPLARGEATEYQAFASPGAEPSWVGRVEAWKGTWHMINAYPVVGSGLGTYRHAFGPFAPPGSPLRWFQAHNDYLQYLAETGLAGLVLLLFGTVLYLRLVLRGGRELGARDRALRLGLLLAVVALAVHSFVDFNLQIPSNGVTFAALAGLGAALASGGVSRASTEPAGASSRLRLSAALGALVVLIALVPLSSRAAARMAADREVGRGIEAMEAERWADAAQRFDAACSRDGGSAAQWQAASESRVMLFDQLQSERAEGDLEGLAGEAVDRAFEATDRNPGAPEGWLALADAYLRRSQARPREPLNLDLLGPGGYPPPPADAPLIRAAARRAVLVDPRSGAALGQAGYVEEVLGDREAAARYYREALRADPLPQSHFFLLGLVPPDWVLESARAGAADALAAGTLVPADTLHLWWAEYLKELGREEEARREYLGAAGSSTSPERRARFLALAGLLAERLGHEEEARATLEEAFALGQDRSAPVLEALGRLRAQEGDEKGAVPLLRRAMALRPRPDTALYLAEIEAGSGQVDRAIGTLRHGMAAAPGDERLYRALIDLLESDGRFVTARAVERQWQERFSTEGVADPAEEP